MGYSLLDTEGSLDRLLSRHKSAWNEVLLLPCLIMSLLLLFFVFLSWVVPPSLCLPKAEYRLSKKLKQTQSQWSKLGFNPFLLISQHTCSGTTLVTISFQLLPMQHIQQWLSGEWLFMGISGSWWSSEQTYSQWGFNSTQWDGGRRFPHVRSHTGCCMVFSEQPHLQSMLL